MRKIVIQSLSGFCAWVTVMSTATVGAADKVYTGRVSPLDGGNELYYYERAVANKGTDIVNIHSTFYPNGEVALIQKASFDGSSHLLNFFEADHKQLAMQATLIVERNNDFQLVTYEKIQDGKLKVATSKLPNGEILVVGPTLYDTIWDRWAELLAGSTVPVRFAAVERLTDIGFNLYMQDSSEEEVVITMRASNLLYRLVVDDITFRFDRRSKQVKSMDGRVPVMKKKGDDWGDLDAHVAYQY